VCIDPSQHDGAVAAVSHLPHWVAALFMQYITGGDDATLKLETAGTGFRDFTRVAQGSPEMWRDIFMANRDAVLAELAALRQVMDRAEHALREHDAVWLEDMLDRAAKARAEWPGGTK
jgi:prephenate dehydrogenase